MFFEIDFDALSRQIHQQNVDIGWWDDPDRCIYTTMQLISDEIAEANEAERKNLMDDHLKHRVGGEVELADALIRTLDLGGKFGWRYSHASSFLYSMVGKKHTIGRQHLACNKALIDLALAYDKGQNDAMLEYFYSTLINTIMKTGEYQGYDIIGALHEKNEYNKYRADHKRENRTGKPGEKMF